MTAATTTTHLETDNAGRLDLGDEFRFQAGGPGTSWGVFTFREHVTLPSGAEHVWCYGGDPSPKGHRQWRAFHAAAVRLGARPATLQEVAASLHDWRDSRA